MAAIINIPPGPSWVVVNADNPISLPLLGQFDPNIQHGKTRPIWQKKPGIAGALPWLKYVGENVSDMTFEFHVIGLTITDVYPWLAWLRLNELAAVDETLGRPPRILFNHGLTLVEGFITDIPAARFQHWSQGNLPALNSRIVREIGPIRVTITKIPKEKSLLSIGTNFIPKTSETTFEDVAKIQYGDSRYSQTLAMYNQGIKDGEIIQAPRKRSGSVSKTTPVAPFFDESIDSRL